MTLLSGATVGQLMALAAAPILSRLFSPTEFGVLGLFLAILGPLSVVASARYELAIVLPEDDDDATQLFVLSLGITTLVSLVLMLAVTAWGGSISTQLGIPRLAGEWWLLPAALFIVGAYQVFSNWSVRTKQFRNLALSQVLSTSGTVAAQVPAGLIGFSSFGLIAGQVLGQFMAAFALGIRIFRSSTRPKLQRIELSRAVELGRRYSTFLLFGSPQALLNALSAATPTLLLSLFFTPHIVGFYVLSIKLLQAPLRIIGQSIRNVFLQASSELKNTTGNIHTLLVQVVLILGAIALLPAACVMLFGPDLFAFVLGEEWREAGVIASILTPWLLVAFVSNPCVVLMNVFELQKVHLVIETSGFIARVAAMAVAASVANENTAILAFSAVGVGVNLGLLIYTLCYTKNYALRNLDIAKLGHQPLAKR